MAKESNKPQVQPLKGHERLAIAMRQSTTQNPLLPLVAHTIERGLRGVTQGGRLDSIFAATLSKYPKTSKAVLQKFVDAYKQVDPTLKAAIVPQRLQNLDTTKALDVSVYALPRTLPAANSAMVIMPGNQKRTETVATVYGRTVEKLRPMLNNLSPDPKPISQPSSGVQKFSPGQAVVLTGGGMLSLKTSANKITIYQSWKIGPDSNETEEKVVATLFPQKVVGQTPTSKGIKLFFSLPANLELGSYYLIKVTNTELGNLDSNSIGFVMAPKPTIPEPPPPVIESILPLKQHPGEKVVITGKNLSKASEIHFTPMDNQQVGLIPPLGVKPSKIISDTQLEITLPLATQYFVLLAGDYYVTARVI